MSKARRPEIHGYVRYGKVCCGCSTGSVLEEAGMLLSGKEVKGLNGIIYRQKEPSQVSKLESMIGFILER